MSKRSNQMGQHLAKGYCVCEKAKEADLALVLIHCETEIVSTILIEGQRKSFLF